MPPVPGSAVHTRALHKAVAVGTFRNGRIILMSTHGNAVQRAEILCYQIVPAL